VQLHYFAKLLPGKLSKIISTFTKKKGTGDHLQKFAWLDIPLLPCRKDLSPKKFGDEKTKRHLKTSHRI
jgi:hypothetical protein